MPSHQARRDPLPPDYQCPTHGVDCDCPSCRKADAQLMKRNEALGGLRMRGNLCPVFPGGAHHSDSYDATKDVYVCRCGAAYDAFLKVWKGPMALSMADATGEP